MQAIAQSGIAFSKDTFDIERYEELRGISAEVLEHYSSLEREKIEALFAKEEGYQTPKVDVRGVVFKENRILLVRERSESRWSLPGGFCDVGLSAAENILKEIREESGYETKAVKFLALLDMNKHPHTPQPYHYYKIFIQCERIGGVKSLGIETDQVDFFARDELPNLSVGRNTEEQIKKMFAFYDDPLKQSIFD